MKIGVNKTVITPEPGIDLAGFGRPDRKMTGTHDDIYVSSMVMEQDGKKVVIICADIIGFGDEAITGIKTQIKGMYGISEDEILLNASHTHSGPQILSNMHPVVGVQDERYIKFFVEKTVSSVQCAMNSMEDAEVYYGKTKCNIGINRRRFEDGGIEFAPNEDGVRDEDVIVLKFVKDGEVKAVIFNYTCHPSTVDTDDVSADYPGQARRVIESALGEQAVVFFIQGCCGNIRIRTIKDKYFRAGTWEDVEQFGGILGKSVVEACSGPMEKLDTRLSAKMMHIQLPLEGIPDKKTLEDARESGSEHEKIWAEVMLSRYDSLKSELPFTIQKISLSDDFFIAAMSGEICVEYGLHVKGLGRGKTPVAAGYCNGLTAYIPTAKMLVQGGYEPEGSTIYFSMPSRFNSDIERIVTESLDKII